MKKVFSLIGILAIGALVSFNASAQKYNGSVSLNKADYNFKTTCGETVESEAAKIQVEYLGLTVAKIKKGKKKMVLVTPCETLTLKTYPDSFKDGWYKIIFTTIDKKTQKLASGVEGTKKEVRFEFEFEPGSVKTKDGSWGSNASDVNQALEKIVGYIATELKL